MKSHTCDFETKDLLQLIGWPLVPLAIFAGAMHLGARFQLLPAPRPTLDTERTILLHQADASRTPHDAEVLLLGDSSCLMDVSARQLSEQLGRPVLNLATFSFLDLNAQASMLREYAKANPTRLRAVVLLMHPEALRRVGSEPYYLKVLTDFWNDQDPPPGDTVGAQAAWFLGAEIFRGRILGRALPVALNGGYGRRYGFNHDLETYLASEHGSAIDPESQPFEGNAEYRLAPTLERASRAFRSTVPTGVKLLVGITPVAEGFAGPRYPQVRTTLLREWGQWLQADATLADLPMALPDHSFVRTTHLKESAIPLYTQKLADAIKPHLP